MNLEGSLILCLLSRLRVYGSPLWYVSSPTMGSRPDLQYYTYVFSCGVDLKSNPKVTDYHNNICITIAPISIVKELI